MLELVTIMLDIHSRCERDVPLGFIPNKECGIVYLFFEESFHFIDSFLRLSIEERFVQVAKDIIDLPVK